MPIAMGWLLHRCLLQQRDASKSDERHRSVASWRYKRAQHVRVRDPPCDWFVELREIRCTDRNRAADPNCGHCRRAAEGRHLSKVMLRRGALAAAAASRP